LGDLAEISPILLDLADEDLRDPAASAALLWVVEEGSALFDTCAYGAESPNTKLMGRALRALRENFMDDPRIGSICLELARIPSPLRDEFFAQVINHSKSREARGRACLALAEYLEMKRGVACALAGPIDESFRKRLEFEIYNREYFAHLVHCDLDALSAESEVFLQWTIEDYGDIDYVRNVANTSFGRRYAHLDSVARKKLADVAQSHLGTCVGKPCKEIDGCDADGKAFRLSDYRGKVIVLTFSGNWCGPCRARYPEERDLVRQMKDKPFVFLSVSTDKSIQTLVESVRAGEITWRCWWDGQDGPICSNWHVQRFPSSFIIDAKGIIRETNVRDGELRRKVDELLREVKN
jgi:peroxiredoxin